MLRLLQELGDWTSEYSGSVSRYQHELGSINDAVKSDVAGSGASDSGHRVVLLLNQIMQSNSDLQTRLEAAEKQLERQTKQIECYLTEARTDGLTGLLNRRAFDQQLDELFAAYRKGGRSFVLALIDIDHFKKINDTHGHQMGDTVLQQIAKILSVNLDNTIMVARFGGEEFVVIMDGPLRVAAERMNELRKKIAKLRLDAGQAQLQVTTSIGLSEPRDDMVVSPVLRRADEALYAAKNIGRNRTYYHDGKSPILCGAPEIAKE
jgi:diguanylate cyclase